MAATGTRPYQVVVWGATGFTGRLVCEHLVRDYKGQVRWAMAGRDQKKLEQIREQLVKIDAAAESVPYIVADANDKASLSDLAAKTDVLIAVAGPYAKYGDKVVEASVEQGTHYCDITGELLWVRRNIQRYHEAAAQKGVKLVHCCGYDSIPFDIGTLVVVDHCQKQLGKNVSQVYGLVEDSRGGVSGGTIASGLNQAEAEDPGEVGQLMGDKYFLLPPGAKHGSDKPPTLFPQWNKYVKKWMAPFVMEPINSRVVQRSNYLAAQPYGGDFKYREAMAVPSLLLAWGITVVTGIIGTVFSVRPLRNFAKSKLPAPGTGPSRDTMFNGYWQHRMVGLTEEPAGQTPQEVVVAANDMHRDGGYWGTARMLLEAGLCLALDEKACAAAGCRTGGVLTPASAMGMVLVGRLRAAGIHFDVVQSPALRVRK